MPLFSELIQAKSTDQQRKLYVFFQRAAKRGEFAALRLLTRFSLVGAKGQPRDVFDYALTSSEAQRVSDWIDQQATAPKVGGVTAEQVQAMTDEQLAALIQKQQKPARKRRTTKKEKATQQAAPASPVHPQEVTD